MKTTFLMLVPVLLAGCMPATAINRYGVQARLVDRANSAIITERDIVVTVDGKEFRRRTNKNGVVEVPADVGFYWTWFIAGPVYDSRPDAQITFECENYTPYRRYWSEFQFRQTDGSIDYRKALDDDGRILLGDVPLKRR
jgi:hypothetical protein